MGAQPYFPLPPTLRSSRPVVVSGGASDGHGTSPSTLLYVGAAFLLLALVLTRRAAPPASPAAVTSVTVAIQPAPRDPASSGDVITPLNVRDPSALVMGPGAWRRPAQTRSRDWKEALARAATKSIAAAPKGGDRPPYEAGINGMAPGHETGAERAEITPLYAPDPAGLVVTPDDMQAR